MDAQEPDQAEPVDTGPQPQSPLLPAPADFIAVNRLIGLILDPRIARKTLRELREAVTASNTAREVLQRERENFDEHERIVRAELTKREQSAVARETAAIKAEASAAERERGLIERGAALRREDLILKKRIAVLAGFSHEMNVPLRAPMSWRDVAAELMQAADLVADKPEMEAVTERVEHAPADSTLRRTRYQPRARSMRRVTEAEA
jgi:signal transduction histidine kinase